MADAATMAEGRGASHCLTQPTSAETVDESAYPYFVRREAECFGLASSAGKTGCLGSLSPAGLGDRVGDCPGPGLTASLPSRLTWCGGVTRLFCQCGDRPASPVWSDRATDGVSRRRVGGGAPSGGRRGARSGHGHLARGVRRSTTCRGRPRSARSCLSAVAGGRGPRGSEFGHRVTGPCAVMCPLRTGTRRNQVPPRRGRRGHREKGAEARSRQPDGPAPGRTGEERSLRCASMS